MIYNINNIKLYIIDNMQYELTQYKMCMCIYMYVCDIVGWRDDSVVKNTGCSSKGPEFSSEHHMVGHDTLFWHAGVHAVRALIHNLLKKKIGVWASKKALVAKPA